MPPLSPVAHVGTITHVAPLSTIRMARVPTARPMMASTTTTVTTIKVARTNITGVITVTIIYPHSRTARCTFSESRRMMPPMSPVAHVGTITHVAPLSTIRMAMVPSARPMMASTTTVTTIKVARTNIAHVITVTIP